MYEGKTIPAHLRKQLKDNEIDAYYNPHKYSRGNYPKPLAKNLHCFYPFSVRDLLENKTFQTAKELSEYYNKLCSEAHPDALPYLKIGFQISIRKFLI